jgi:hypothetical protein
MNITALITTINPVMSSIFSRFYLPLALRSTKNMQVQHLSLHRLFLAMTLVLCTGLLGLGCMETFLLQPLRQSINQGVIGHQG